MTCLLLAYCRYHILKVVNVFYTIRQMNFSHILTSLWELFLTASPLTPVWRRKFGESIRAVLFWLLFCISGCEAAIVQLFPVRPGCHDVGRSPSSNLVFCFVANCNAANNINLTMPPLEERQRWQSCLGGSTSCLASLMQTKWRNHCPRISNPKATFPNHASTSYYCVLRVRVGR